MISRTFSPKIRRWLRATSAKTSINAESTLHHPSWRLGTLFGCGIGSLAFALGYLAEAPDSGTPDRMIYAFGSLAMLLVALVIWRSAISIRTLGALVIGGSGAFFVYRLVYMLYFAPPSVDIPKEMTESFFWMPVVYLLGYLIPNLTHGRRLAFTVTLFVSGFSALYLLTPFDPDVALALAQLNLANWTFAYAVRNLSVYQEMTLRAQGEREIMARLATTDPLTGIANRRAFEERLEALLGESQRSGKKFALVFVDLDRFKAVNDTYGHPVGDELLVAIARRLRHAVRQGDTLARLSGDEFALLLADVHTVAEAARIAETLQGRFQTPFKLSGVTLSANASIGFSLYPDDGTSATELLQLADKAMYRVKAQARTAEIADAPPNGKSRVAIEPQPLEHSRAQVG